MMMAEAEPATGTQDQPATGTEQPPATGTPDPATGDGQQDRQQQQPPTAEQLQAEVDRLTALHRKQEQRAKDNAAAARELETLKRQQLPEIERKVAEAVDQARAEERARVGARLVDAEVRAAAAGRDIDVTALLEVLDRGSLVGDDGEPDGKKIKAWIDKIAPAREQRRSPDFGQGARGTNGSGTGDMNSILRASRFGT